VQHGGVRQPGEGGGAPGPEQEQVVQTVPSLHHGQPALDQGFTSRMTSSSTGEPSGRLATPKTRREEMVASPKTSRSSSDTASATFGCSVSSGVAAIYTPSRTTRLTRFNEPSCFLVSASALSAAVYAASRPAFTSSSLPTMPATVAVWPDVASIP